MRLDGEREAGMRNRRMRSRRRCKLASIVTLASLSATLAVASSAAGTMIAPEPGVGPGAPSLPDARSYEQVSPRQKSGNEAGYLSTLLQTAGYAIAGSDGEGILFEGDGPFGESASGADSVSVARRSTAGWSTKAALPPGYGIDSANFTKEVPEFLYPSASLSELLFTAGGSFVKGNPIEPGGSAALPALYLAAHAGTAVEPSWLGEPTIPIAEVTPPSRGAASFTLAPAGGTPNLETAYFTWGGTLVPEDASRAANVNNGTRSEASGFYEYRDGLLRSAGELPQTGEFSPYGAAPASFGLSNDPRQFNAQNYNNEVAAEGTRAFFVSPDPNFCGALSESKFEESTYCEEGAEPVELYVREQHPGGPPTTVLVSRNVLSGGTQAPGYLEESSRGGGHRYTTGVTPMLAPGACEAFCPEYVYASADGSRAFFQSKDVLAKSASGEMPAGSGPWTYEFNLQTDTVTYLPGVVGAILASSQDGSRFVFATPQPSVLDLWDNGTITEIGELPIPPETQSNEGGKLSVTPVRATESGSAFMFQTDAPVPGFNDAGGYQQVYRYAAPNGAAPQGELGCVSCPEPGLIPSGDAHMTNDEAGGASPKGEAERLSGSRGMSADGTEVFFDTPEALVRDDTNAQRDVYEWEQAGAGSCPSTQAGGCRFLISSGRSPDPSIFLDNSESGSDVFFATTQGLVPADGDESYDVYDARSPHHLGEQVGFPAPVAPAGCSGSACQGPAGTAPLAPAILTSTNDVSGNLVAPAQPVSKPRHLTRVQRLANALMACRHQPKRKRARCVRRAKLTYGVARTAQRGRGGSSSTGGRR